MRERSFLPYRTGALAATLGVAFLLLASTEYSHADELPWCASIERQWRPPCQASSVCIENPGYESSCTYVVPRDCERIEDIPYWEGTNVAFKMGQGLQNLCNEIKLQKAKHHPVRLDFVSDVDWNTLPIKLLPFDFGCSDMPGEFFSWCRYVAATNPNATLLNFYVWQGDWRLPDSDAPIGKGCHLEDGVFDREIVQQEDGRIDCLPDDEPGNISFSRPFYGDFNQDQIQDVSVLFGWWGGGSLTDGSRTELTRLSSSGPFIMVSDLKVPFECESTPDAFEQAVCSSPKLRIALNRFARFERFVDDYQGESTAPSTLSSALKRASARCFDGRSATEAGENDTTECLLKSLGEIFARRREKVCALPDIECRETKEEPPTRGESPGLRGSHDD